MKKLKFALKRIKNFILFLFVICLPDLLSDFTLFGKIMAYPVLISILILFTILIVLTSFFWLKMIKYNEYLGY